MNTKAEVVTVSEIAEATGTTEPEATETLRAFQVATGEYGVDWREQMRVMHMVGAPGPKGPDGLDFVWFIRRIRNNLTADVSIIPDMG